MKREFTLTEIGELFATLDRLNAEEANLLKRQLRNLAATGFLTRKGSEPRFGGGLYGVEDVYRARVFTALVQAGYRTDAFKKDSEFYADIWRAMHEFDHYTVDLPQSQRGEGVTYDRGGLRNSIIGIAAGENWRLTHGLNVVITPDFNRRFGAFHEVSRRPDSLENPGVVRNLYSASLNLNDLFAGLPALDDQ